MRQLTIAIAVLISLPLVAQNERKMIREGIKAYQAGDFSDAEVQFRKATDVNAHSFEADFNTGAALYEQEKYEETVKQYEPLVQRSSDPAELAQIWHNMGNSLLEAQQYEPSIEAYKNSLRLKPDDMDTKYNLAYAKQKLQEQQQNQQQQQPQDQENQENQEQQENQDQQNQENQEQQEKEQQEQQEEEQQNQENQEPQEQEQQEQEAKPLEISKEDAERMLEAIQQQEKDVKEKVDQKKAAVAKVKTEKDW